MICDVCFLIECCCEADRIEDEKRKQKEIKMFHNAKPGSRLFRKMYECPCEYHSSDFFQKKLNETNNLEILGESDE